MAPYEHRQLREALEQAATERSSARSPGRAAGRPSAAEPVRYKPGDRCVIRYRLRLQRAASATGAAGRSQPA